LRVGSLGTDTEFINPYLDNTLVIWDDESQAGVDSGQKRELSSSYRYTADMTPGEHQGVDYDGRMTAIYGNHVALVEAGRAGPDVIVGDAQLGQGDFIMAVKPRTSHRATLALGAITGFVSPRLAADAKLDATGITAILKDTTAKNWLQRKPRLATALSTALGKVKLANDAKPEPDEIHRLLDSLDAIVGDEEMDDGAEDETETEEERAERMEDRAEDRKHGLDAAADEDPETEEEKKKRMEARDRKVRRANDARRKLGHDESEEEKKKREDDDRVMRAKDKRPGMDRGAMDAAIKKAVKDTEDRVIARLNGIAQAKADVLPYVADFTGAADSAEEIYRFALDQAGVAHDGIREIAALKAMVGLLPKPGDPALAVDHAATLNRGTPSDDWLKSFNVPV
jgi:hypothetical protein